jgi:predicted permease
MRQVLVFDVPPPATGVFEPKVITFFKEVTRRVSALPGVEGVALGTAVPWRDAGEMLRTQFAVEGYEPADGEENPRPEFRIVSPRFFEVLGVPLVAGRDFTDDDGGTSEQVAIVSQSFAQRVFPNGDALNRKLRWTDPTVKLFGLADERRIVGIVADFNDETIGRAPVQTVYHPVQQMHFATRLFVRTSGDSYSLVPAVSRVIREISADQPVERAATLEDVRAEVLSPERVNAFVFSGFAGIALLIAVVGVAGVLAFSVSARTREFGIRLAVGSAPRHLLARVLAEGVAIGAGGIAAGAIGGFLLARIAGRFFEHMSLPGVLPVVGATAVLIGAAVVASLMPAARASRVDVLQALRSE